MAKKNDIYLSVVIPMYNEEKSVKKLYAKLLKHLDPLKKSYEIVFIDDGSIDKTLKLLLELQKDDKRIKIVKLRGNFGQTSALAAGFDHSIGEVIVSMDGDLQHDPSDIKKLLKKMDEGYDIVSGWRKDRVDNLILRKIPSKIANYMMAKLTKVDIHDFGTTLKAYRRDVIQSIRLYGQFHRFIPALASEVGATITEVPIKNIMRKHGKSNYGIFRTFTVFFDLIRIKFLLSYMSKPLQVFGLVGILMLLAGGGVFSYLTFLKYAYGTGYGLMEYRAPLFIMSVFLMVSGIQLFTMGLLGEIIVKSLYDSGKKQPYYVDKIYS